MVIRAQKQGKQCSKKLAPRPAAKGQTFSCVLSVKCEETFGDGLASRVARGLQLLHATCTGPRKVPHQPHNKKHYVKVDSSRALREQRIDQSHTQ